MEIKFLTEVWNGLTKSTYSIVGSDNNKKVYLTFDSIDGCSTHGSASAVRVPIETGQNVTDYKYSNPTEINLRGVISKNGTFGLGFADINYSVSLEDKNNLIKNVLDECRKLTREMTLVDIQTRNSGVYKYCTMVDYNINENPDNYNLLEVDMSFEEVIRFDVQGNLTRNVSDQDTTSVGIVETLTQSIKEWWS